MIPRIASPVLFLASLLPLAATQETDATCVLASSQWSFNSANQSPCSVASSLLGVCSGGSYDVKGLPEGSKYLGPSIDGANQCQCSTVTYSLISACALCQNRTISSWTEWSGNCPSVFISTYPSPIPQGTLVPGWAYLDVKTAGFFDEDDAKKNANATESTAIPIPSSTSSVATSTTSSAEPAQTSSPDDITAEQATRGERRSDTIGSAVVGALVGLIVIVGIIAGLYVRKQRRKKAAQPNNHPTDADGSSVEKDSAMGVV
ncbi:hypothetical protein Moror_836 [Moniliophthora roreri MCA 2997]|uniref:Uncharacterized protein n=1 Tax=Moniliophthora roreri (strain MCA 2997) TaxID=1381753 RepID=V2XAL8_MONRO|nr:hypothetical protein Moror_836 [Moniliophthora roreri MCA 2997]